MVALILSLAFTLGLSACGGQSSTSAATSEDGAATNPEALMNQPSEPGGEPWENTVWSTSLPEEKPTEADDLYLAVSYDWLKEAKEAGVATTRTQGDVTAARTALAQTLSDESATGNGIDQLRIFYNQAYDLDALAEQGIDAIQPYIDAVMATNSLDELKALLVSEDFPFNPWFTFGISVADKRETNLVDINPNLLLSDMNMTGGDPYQDSDDPTKADAVQQMLMQDELYATYEISLILGSQGDEVSEMAQTISEFEKSYAKELETTYEAQNAAYGEASKKHAPCTMEELESTFTNFPIKELLTRYGKDKSAQYIVTDFDWATPFNDLWTDDNFETLRMMTAVKVFHECKDFIDPEILGPISQALTQTIPTAEEVAYTACNKLATFSDAIAQNYADTVLGKSAVDRLTKLSKNLVAAYKEMFNETTWFEEETRTKMLEKLDNMTLNILYPESGYFDYSGLKLKTSEEGGTLISNYLAIKDYRNEQDNALIGTPATADMAWRKIAPTEINCFYAPQDNSINIYPGFINSATYSDDMSDVELLSTIGSVIAHEISHGFDYAGSQYDAYGLSNPLFVGDDADDFVERSNKLADYYSTISYDDEGNKVNGVDKLTEAAADLSGVQVVLEYAEDIDGIDYKTLFENYAFMWATSYPPVLSATLISDTHPLAYLRGNVNVQMFDEFYETFDVKEGDGMYLAPEDRVLIWGDAA